MVALILLQILNIVIVTGYLIYTDNITERYKDLKHKYNKLKSENDIINRYLEDTYTIRNRKK